MVIEGLRNKFVIRLNGKMSMNAFAIEKLNVHIFMFEKYLERK